MNLHVAALDRKAVDINSEALVDTEVAGNHHLHGSDVHASALRLRSEWVLVTPVLQ